MKLAKTESIIREGVQGETIYETTVFT